MAESSADEDLSSLPYRQLQKLAKERGVKANLPKAKLLLELAEAEAEAAKANSNANDDAPALEEAAGRGRSSSSSEQLFDSLLELDKDDDEYDDGEVSFLHPGATPKPTARPKSPRTYSSGKGKGASPGSSKRFAEFTAESSPPASLDTPKQATKTPKTASASAKTPRLNTPRHSISSAKPRPSLSSSKGPLRARLSGTPASVNKAKSGQKKPAPAAANATHIPRFVSKRMPDFSKLHAQEFKKMDSLDVHLSKKKDRVRAMAAHSGLDPKPVSFSATKAAGSAKKAPTPSMLSASITVRDKPSRPPTRRSPRNAENARPAAVVKPFQPSNLVVGDKSFNFNRVAGGGTGKKPFVFTASPRKSAALPGITPKQKILHNITNSSQAGTPGSASKKFDLKASLAKPLKYKPYTGKLKSWAEEKKDERKAMSMKTGAGAGGAAGRKNLVKGVRMNKRAELLMKKRNA